MFAHRHYPAYYFPGRYFPPVVSMAPVVFTPQATFRLVCGYDTEIELSCGDLAQIALTMTYENAAMILVADYEDTLLFSIGTNDMPPDQLIRIIRAQDLSLKFTMDRPRSVSGWSVTFQVKTKLGGTSALSKTVGSGVTLTDTGRGVITVSLAKADTSGLTLTSALASGEGYVWNLKRTDSGSNVVLARGEFILEQEVTA